MIRPTLKGARNHAGRSRDSLPLLLLGGVPVIVLVLLVIVSIPCPIEFVIGRERVFLGAVRMPSWVPPSKQILIDSVLPGEQPGTHFGWATMWRDLGYSVAFISRSGPSRSIKEELSDSGFRWLVEP